MLINKAQAVLYYIYISDVGVAYSLLVIVVIYSLDGGGCMMFNKIPQTICRFVLLLLTLLLIIGVVVRFSLFT